LTIICKYYLTMSEKADYKIENILLTLKKHKNQTFEVLYFSSEIRDFLSENENVASNQFYERLLPGLKRPLMDFFFGLLGSQNKVLTPFLINNHQFQFVQIEGSVIAQEDKSYLVNILLSDKNPASEINLSWLLNPSRQEFYSYCKNFSAASLRDINYLRCFLLERFNFLNEDQLEKFLQQEREGKFEIFTQQLYLNKEKLANGYYLVSLTFSSLVEGDLAVVDLESYDQIIRQYSGAIYYEHLAGKKDVKWTGATFQLIGYTQQEMSQITMLDWMELIHPEDRNSLVTGFESDLDMGIDYEVVYRIKHKTGHYIYVHDLAKPFFKSETGKQIILGTIKDVSELKKVEKDLLDNKSKLNELTGVVPGMVYMMKYLQDDTHNFVFVSEGAKQLFETDPELIRQSEHNLIKFIHPDDVEQVLKADRYAYENDVKFESQFRIITPSGKLKWVYGASSRLPQYEKESVWAGFFIDISYTKRKEEEANYNFQRYRALFEESPLAILQFDREGKILGANRNLLKKIKIKDESEVLGQNLHVALTGLPVNQLYEESLELGQAFYEGPYVSIGNQIPTYVRVNATAIDKGDSFQAIIEEVSEQDFFQNILNKVADLSTKLRGLEFFQQLCELLTKRFNLNYCYIGQIGADKSSVDILALAKDGKFQEPFSYNLQHSPCKEMLNDEKSNYKLIPNQVLKAYPNDPVINKLNIQSYAGISLLDASHRKVGVLAFLDERPMENLNNFVKILKILGDRIGAELQRQKYEQELLRTNKLQETILNGSDYAIFSIDEEMRVNLINHKTLEFFNISDKDKLLEVKLVSGGQTNSLKELILKSSGQKNKADYFLLPMENGQDRELKLSFISITESQSDNLTYVVFADDITDRTAAEKKLQESEQLYRSIAENFPKGTVDVLDKDLRYIYTEGKEYEVIGLNPKDLIGSFHLLKYEAEVAQEAKTHLSDVLDGKTVMYEVTYGGQYYLKSGVPLYNAAGKINRILLVTQNITDSKKSEKEREKLIKDLKSHNEELQRFAYIVSHNLRAPIVNISALLNLYNEEDPADVENEEVIEHLKISTELLSSTLMDLIEVVSIRKQKLPKVESLSFQHVLHNVERSLHQQITESKAVITTDFEDVGEINYVYSHLENFFLNFLTNAIKYKHPERDPSIQISAYKMGEYHVVSFSDNGIGLDLERYGDRLFGLYQRFHSHVDGKGLGLYLVREQIRAYDGDLTVESTVGEGTTFKAYLKNMRYSPSPEMSEHANQD